jgi:hypothetical protein
MIFFSAMTDDELTAAKADPSLFVSTTVSKMVDFERVHYSLMVNAPAAEQADIQAWIDRLVAWANPPGGVPASIQDWGREGAAVLTAGEQLVLKYGPRGMVLDTTDLHKLLDVPGEYPAETYNPLWSTGAYQAAKAAGATEDQALAAATGTPYPPSEPTVVIETPPVPYAPTLAPTPAASLPVVSPEVAVALAIPSTASAPISTPASTPIGSTPAARVITYVLLGFGAWYFFLRRK